MKDKKVRKYVIIWTIIFVVELLVWMQVIMYIRPDDSVSDVLFNSLIPMLWFFGLPVLIFVLVNTTKRDIIWHKNQEEIAKQLPCEVIFRRDDDAKLVLEIHTQASICRSLWDNTELQFYNKEMDATTVIVRGRNLHFPDGLKISE